MLKVNVLTCVRSTATTSIMFLRRQQPQLLEGEHVQTPACVDAGHGPFHKHGFVALKHLEWPISKFIWTLTHFNCFLNFKFCGTFVSFKTGASVETCIVGYLANVWTAGQHWAASLDRYWPTYLSSLLWCEMWCLQVLLPFAAFSTVKAISHLHQLSVCVCTSHLKHNIYIILCFLLKRS